MNMTERRAVLPEHADVLSGVRGDGRLQPQSLSVFTEPRAAESHIKPSQLHTIQLAGH